MAGKAGDWMVHFRHGRCENGYEWEPLPEHKRLERMGVEGPDRYEIIDLDPHSGSAKLVIKGAWRMQRRNTWDRAVYFPSREISMELSGDAYARKAIRNFRSVCRFLEPYSEWLDRWDERIEDSHNSFHRQQEFNIAAKSRILEFSNEFGLLWGDHDPRSLSDWLKASDDFREIDFLARTLQTGSQKDRAEFRSRLNDDREWHQDGGGNLPQIRFQGLGITYRTGRHSRETLIRTGQLEGYKDDDGTIVWFDVGDEFANKPLDHKIWEVFSLLIGRKLRDGIAIMPGEFMGRDSGVVTTDLETLIYLRLWLDTVMHRPVPKYCDQCGSEILEGNRNRKYCSDACRQRSYRNRSISAQTHT